MGLELVSQLAQPGSSHPPEHGPHVLRYMTECDVCGRHDAAQITSHREDNHKNPFLYELRDVGESAVTAV